MLATSLGLDLSSSNEESADENSRNNNDENVSEKTSKATEKNGDKNQRISITDVFGSELSTSDEEEEPKWKRKKVNTGETIVAEDDKIQAKENKPLNDILSDVSDAELPIDALALPADFLDLEDVSMDGSIGSLGEEELVEGLPLRPQNTPDDIWNLAVGLWRQHEFRSKVACHNDVAQLECNPYSRIAVYSASFGRTEYESIQCPQPQGVREETCLASYATETVMQICHGRRRCNLAADANTFGSPCQPNSRMYLKVVYTCVPRQVLKDRFESDIEADEMEYFDGDFNDFYDDDLSYKESEAIPKLYSNATTPATSSTSNKSNSLPTNLSSVNNSMLLDADSGGIDPVMTHSADLSLNDDQERLYLYLLISGSVCVIICIVAIAVRLLLQKHHTGDTDLQSSSSLKGGNGGIETTVPNGFNDTISEIDADIDLSTPLPLPSVSQNENYITYCPPVSLYGNLGPSNVSSHSPSTLLLQGGTRISGATTGVISNPLLCSGPRQSPDIIGISSNAYATTSNASGDVLAPTVVFSGDAAVVSSVGSIRSIGAAVPISSLAQCTTAPTFRSGYIISPDGTLQRPLSTATPPGIMHGGAVNLSYSSSQHQSPARSILLSSTSTLRRAIAATDNATSPPLVQQPSYDGTAPRTLPTGLPVNSPYYYG